VYVQASDACEREREKDAMLDPESLRQLQVVYRLPGMERAHIRKELAYTSALGEELCADVYSPPDVALGVRLPAVIFVSGDGPPTMIRGLKESGAYVGWGRLAAASELIGVTFDHHSTEEYRHLTEIAGEIEALLAFLRDHADALGIDATRLAIWTCSGGPPFGLRESLLSRPTAVRCTVVYYGFMDPRMRLNEDDPPERVELLTAYSPVLYLGQSQHNRPIAPLLVVRAGADHPVLNRSIDAFVAEALARNAPLEVINYPEGHHAFDILDDTDESRAIIQRTLAFLRQHLVR
jgi:dienelactone hydrolase